MDNQDLQRIWGDETIRVFISHTHLHQANAAELQVALSSFGIASFVAHNDIEPTRQWEVEIIKALQSMHILVAFLTDDFKNSAWTDQEVGAAVGRGVPVFPISMGCVPYGFMQRYQAIPGSFGVYGGVQKISTVIFDSILSDDRLESLAVDAYVSGVKSSHRYARTDMFASSWNRIGKLSDQQARSLLQAYNSNNQVSGAGTFDDIIVSVMREATGEEYEVRRSGARGVQCVPARIDTHQP